MNEQELNALIDERVKTFEATTPSPTQAEAVKSEPAVDVNEIVAAAVKATAARYEKMLIEARRPVVPGAPTVIRQKGKSNPLSWAVKAITSVPGGIVLRQESDDLMTFSAQGDERAVKAFVAFAQRANADIETSGAAGRISVDPVPDPVAAKALVSGSFVPQVNTVGVIQALYAEAIARRLPGVNFYPMPAPIADAPTLAAFTSAWKAENAQIVASAPAQSYKRLTAKKLTTLAQLPNELLRDSNTDAERYIREGMALSMAAAFDAGGFTGAGTDEPTGLLSESGPASTAYATDLYTSIAAAIGRLLTNKVPAANICVIGHPAALIKAVQSRSSTPFDTAQAPIGSLVGGMNLFAPLAARLGVPVFSTPCLPVATGTASSTVLVLHAPSWTVGVLNELELAASNSAGNAFEYDQTYIRAILRGDFVLQRAVALEKITAVLH